jgi:hypothetical protein
MQILPQSGACQVVLDDRVVETLRVLSTFSVLGGTLLRGGLLRRDCRALSRFVGGFVRGGHFCVGHLAVILCSEVSALVGADTFITQERGKQQVKSRPGTAASASYKR